MLPIQQTLNLLAPLNRTLRAVLIEVCTMAEHGKHGAFTAANDHLATRLVATNRTISRSLAELQRLGLLVVSGSTTKRRIVAAPQLRTCYTGSEAANMAAVAALSEALSIDKTTPMSIDNQGMSIDNDGQCLETSEVVSIDIQGRVYIEKNKEEHKKNIEEVERELASLRSALASAQSSLVQVTADRDTLAREVTTLKADNARLRTPGGAALDLTFPDWATPAFRAEWQQWVTFRQGKRDKLKPASLQKMLDKLSTYDEEFCGKLFDKAITNGYTGLIYEDTDRKFAEHLAAKPENAHLNLNRHATSTRNHGTNYRPAAGTKPDYRAGQMAGAFAGAIWGAGADNSDLPFKLPGS